MVSINKYMRFAAITTASAIFSLGIAGCSMMGMGGDKGAAMTGTELSKPSENIVQIATGDNMESVTTLVKAVQAADLVSTLEGTGPFTVFAPTNEAFAKLPPGTLEMLLKPENKDKLKDILLYHVVSGQKIMAADVKTMGLQMADGKMISVSASNGMVTLSGPTNSAKVIKTDIVASNGVIHWIDTVLLPN